MTDIKPLTPKQQWYQNNKEYIAKYNREYHLKNRERVNNLMKEYNTTHQSEIREYRQQYGIIKKDEIKKRQREYRIKAKERQLLIEKGLTPEPTEPVKKRRVYRRLGAVEKPGLTPEQINDLILNNQRHLEFIENQRRSRIENVLMALEDTVISQ